MPHIAYPAEQITLSDVEIDQSLRNATINPIKLKAKHTPEFKSIMLKASIQGLELQIVELAFHCQHERIIVALASI